MRKIVTVFVASFLIPCFGTSGVKIEVSSNERKEVASPMTVTASIETSTTELSAPHSKPLFEINELASTVCDAVILKSVMARVTFNKTHSKGEFLFYVRTYTEPPQDKKAVISVEVKNDEEVLLFPTSQFPKRDHILLKVNAEETKTRSKSMTARIDPEQLDRILSGENPRVQITLEVRDN